jgi:hypothetical protein
VLTGPGLVIRLSLKQLDLAKAVYRPDAPNGVADA